MSTFDQHIQAGAMGPRVFWTAWRAWLALTNQEDDPNAVERLDHWRDDWRDQLMLRSTVDNL